MMAFTSSLTSTLIIPTPSPYKPLLNLPIFPQIKTNPRKPSTRFVTRAQNPDERESKGDGDDAKGNGRPRLNLKWVDLVLDPDPDNVVAVGLTGVLAWASVQVLWQLFFISLAILVAALKYSFIAALLILVLVTLL